MLVLFAILSLIVFGPILPRMLVLFAILSLIVFGPILPRMLVLFAMTPPSTQQSVPVD